MIAQAYSQHRQLATKDNVLPKEQTICLILAILITDKHPPNEGQCALHVLLLVFLVTSFGCALF